MGEELGTYSGTYRPTSVKDLVEILNSSGQRRVPRESMNEVYPNLYIGNERAALDIKAICRQGITHVINAAKGKRPFQHVDIDPALYEDRQIEYLAIEATDVMGFKMSQHFDKTSDFLDQSLSNEGTVLVHCKEGVSRSAILVLAFLVGRRSMTALDAVRLVRKSREIFPNTGFLQQLCDLEKNIYRHRTSEACPCQLPLGNTCT